MVFLYTLVTMLMRVFFFLSFFSGSVSAAEYEITARFVSPVNSTVSAACSTLDMINTIHEMEKNPTEEERKRIEEVKSYWNSDDIRRTLSEWFATVTLSVKLPARLVMNTENFSVRDFNGDEIRVFRSDDIFYYMDENGVITLDGQGRTSLRLDLTAVAFCSHITDENKTPSVETALSDLIQEASQL